MTDVPAFVQNGRLDVLATNALGRAMYCDLYDDDIVRGAAGRPPNHARYTFLDPRSADFYPDWNLAARTGVALLRAEAGRRPDDRVLTELDRRADHPQRPVQRAVGGARRPAAHRRHQALPPPRRR